MKAMFLSLVLPLTDAFTVSYPLHTLAILQKQKQKQQPQLQQQQQQQQEDPSKLLFVLHAKRSRRGRQDMDDMDRWYDTPRSSSTPDDVFWEEMDRQRLMNKLGGEEQYAMDINNSNGNGNNKEAARAVASTATSFQSFQNNFKPSPTLEQQVEQQNRERTTENTLTEYLEFQVRDNWLNEQFVELYGTSGDGEIEQLDQAEQDRLIEEALKEDDEHQDSNNNNNNSQDAWMTDAEPWDVWGQPRETAELSIKINPDYSNEFLVTSDDYDHVEDAQMEVDFLESMRNCGIHSQRLNRARDNPKAKAFFQREPDALEGFDRMWVCAIDPVCYQNLAGAFRNYGVQFADNFGDFADLHVEDGHYSIEEVASYKARQVYEVTGLPVVTMRTSFEIEPIPPTQPGGIVTKNQNPLVSSGYRFNNIGDHVDHMIEALKPLSDHRRVTRYRTCLCYYDGDMELYEFSTLDCDLHWATSLRTFIPVNQAINQICKSLQLTFGLEYMKWLQNSQKEALTKVRPAVVNLRDRVLRDGRVLPNSIIDVSSFMDSMVDVNLMDDCAKELAERFKELKPTKILTVATTGLVIALPMAKYLQVPVVYARKEKSVVMADTYKANYSSKTVGKNKELIVSKAHLTENDRVLVVDDFLSSGAVQDALLRIVSDAGSEVVGVGVLLEKVYDSGRQSLSGFNIPVESLCRVASVKEGSIQLVEEEGYNLM